MKDKQRERPERHKTLRGRIAVAKVEVTYRRRPGGAEGAIVGDRTEIDARELDRRVRA